MIDPIVLLAFLPAGLALNLTPGADMMFCLAQGMRGGPRPALAASGGIALGALVHATLAGLGLGALLETFPWAFGAIRWGGAAYLLWLAYRTLSQPMHADGALPVRPQRAFRDGLVVNLSNPKVILFILAFIPQFVDATQPILPQFLVFGAMLSAGGFVINGAVGWFAGGIGRWLATSPGAERGFRYVSASIFAGLAARIGWEAARA
ncbi:LysE family transporter [Rhodobacterales bacterium HKCCE2091]|nr:LysE family transporter [Rhodobacterales bacterium HKCCE2091]